jgi:bleomycin hydrolase
MDKKTRLLFNDSLMTHAMVFTGYDVPMGTAPGDGAGFTKWRVENSWGDGSDKGPGGGCSYSLKKDAGYYLMTDEWFSVRFTPTQSTALSQLVSCIFTSSWTLQ